MLMAYAGCTVSTLVLATGLFKVPGASSTVVMIGGTLLMNLIIGGNKAYQEYKSYYKKPESGVVEYVIDEDYTFEQNPKDYNSATGQSDNIVGGRYADYSQTYSNSSSGQHYESAYPYLHSLKSTTSERQSANHDPANPQPQVQFNPRKVVSRDFSSYNSQPNGRD